MPTDTLPEAPAADATDTTVADTDTTQDSGTQAQTPATFDPSKIDPQVKSHFDKQYEGYEKYKGMATEYEQILRSKEFQEWYQGLRQPKAQTQPQEISDEEFVAALSDKTKLSQLIRAESKRLMNEEFGPQLQQTQQKLELTAKTNELNEVIAKNPDFMDLDKRGLIEPYLKKYPGISFEDAYWLGKKHTMNEEIDRRARGLVDSKKAASVEKPGATTGAKSRKVKAKSKLEAMEIAAEAFKAGREAPEIEFE